MSIVKDLTIRLGGKYYADTTKKVHSPEGTFIYHNGHGIIEHKQFKIEIFLSSNMGVRPAETRDGSPYKIVLTVPFELKTNLSIFPKSFLEKLLRRFAPQLKNSIEANSQLNNYKIKCDIELAKSIFRNQLLSEKISNHDIFISTRVLSKNSKISLRPNESVTELYELRELYEIMESLGKVIVDNRSFVEY